MRYNNTYEAFFISRPNRFVAKVLVDGQEETVHVKNTGRCEELLYQGVRVILEKSDNPGRKTAYDLIAVYKEKIGWINIDSQAPNAVVKEWLENKIPFENNVFPGTQYLKAECQYGISRIDFYMETDDRKILLEVKGCTLEKDCMGFFPDAPTERGVKHLRELTEAVKEGYESYLAFVIQMNGIDFVLPNKEMQPEFRDALRDAIKGGVKLVLLSCSVTPDSLEIIKSNVIDCL